MGRDCAGVLDHAEEVLEGDLAFALPVELGHELLHYAAKPHARDTGARRRRRTEIENKAHPKRSSCVLRLTIIIMTSVLLLLVVFSLLLLMLILLLLLVPIL